MLLFALILPAYAGGHLEPSGSTTAESPWAGVAMGCELVDIVEPPADRYPAASRVLGYHGTGCEELLGFQFGSGPEVEQMVDIVRNSLQDGVVSEVEKAEILDLLMSTEVDSVSRATLVSVVQPSLNGADVEFIESVGLASDDAMLRLWGVRQLGELQISYTEPLLTSLLFDSHEIVAVTTAQYLRTIPAPSIEIVEVLSVAALDGSRSVRMAATHALGSQGELAVPALLNLVNETDPLVAVSVAESLLVAVPAHKLDSVIRQSGSDSLVVDYLMVLGAE